MNEQLVIQTLLQKHLAQIQSRKPQFSVRAFARILGLQPGATSEILKGKRRVSVKVAERIVERLLLSPTERFEVLRLFQKSEKRSARSNKLDCSKISASMQISSQQFQIISEWEHFAILSLVRLRDFRSDPEWIASRLNVGVARVKACIERLLALEFLVEKNGTLERAVPRLNSSDDIHDLSVQKAHLQDLELARESLIAHSVEVRDFCALTFPSTASPAKLKKAKTILREAQDEVAALLCEETKGAPVTEVYRLVTQLFPLTQVLPRNPIEGMRK